MRRLLSALAVLAAFVVAGCGLGAGSTPGATSLLVTQDFGAKVLTDLPQPELSGEDTVMRMLDRNVKTEKRYGGKFIQTIGGVSGGERGGLGVDWIFYVNGVQADKGATSVKLHDGDAVWWDNHAWETSTVGAVVGSFPEPFAHGIDGRRLPVRIECADPDGDACRTIQERLVEAKVPASRARLAAQLEEDTLRIVVGPIQRVRGDRAVSLLAEGPETSGVFAKPSADGKSFQVLDPTGKVVQTIGAGSGLIAAIAPPDNGTSELPVWVVTGTDADGVAAAAAAFDEGTLSRKFALAISGDGIGIALPQPR
ncbi:MAG TPA: DUF4430 domain-containing protein [Baekduia sp.]|nr:DUF4430 domain-containing protein [Baekduia sp.]